MDNLTDLYRSLLDDDESEENIKFYATHLEYRLAALANSYDTTLDECLELAYDEIKDRKGKLIDGVFVKESDLK